MGEMGDENNIDLHADTDDLSLFNLKLERSETNDSPDPEMEALFDSVVTSGGSIDDEVIKTEKDSSIIDKAGEECPVTEGPGSSEIAPSVHKFGVLVGNLTWWTTDLDVENCLKAIGVDDLIDIKFIDNRTNGQSKGYCSVQVGSDRSIRLIHDKLPKRELHDREIMVAAPSKVATAQFESQSDCKPRLPPANMGPAGCNPRNSMLPPPGMIGPPQPYGIAPPPGAPRAGGPRPCRNMNGSDVNSPSGPRMMSMGHPHQRPPPPPMPQHHMNYGPPPPRSHGLPFHPHNPRPPYRPHHQAGHPPYSFPLPPSMDHRGPPTPRPEWLHNPPGPQHGPPINNQMPPHCPPGTMGHPPLEMNLGSPPGPPLNDGPPAPHVNPAFFHSPYSSSPTMPVPIQDGPPSKVSLRSRDNPLKISTFVPHNRHSEDRKPPPPDIDRFPILNPILSDAEMGEGLSRNRSVSSSAISRAVTDAAKGDFPSAIETLVTAISLIKQSRVGNDDRSKILVASLQDTLHGIESKSYGRFRAEGHARANSRSRSRDRTCGGYRRHSHNHHHYRSRSRSRERSRSRDHFHRERRRSRSLSSSRGRDFERSSKLDDRDRYREQERERERHKREQEHDHGRERDSGSRSSRGNGNTRSHEDSEHHEHMSSRR